MVSYKMRARSELAAYHISSAPSCAMYLITGEVPPTRKSYDDEMDVDGDDERYLDDYDDEEDDEGFMPETKIVLVGEDNLECKSCLHLPPLYRQINLIL
jgi:hypothetical protein